MAIRTDQYANSLTVVDTVNANAPLNLIPQGTGGVNIPGTGQNLWLGSSSFTNPTYWNGSNASVTGLQTDPFGGTSAALVTADGTVNNHSIISFAYTFPLGVTFTESAYFKAGTNNFIQLRTQGAIGGVYTNFNLSTGVIGDTTALASSITSVGNGWYRCAITFTPTANASSGFQIYVVTSNTATAAESNTLTTSFYIFGAQLEVGSTVGTYIPTTSAAVYGTPKLSLSGVASIGLQSDGSLYVSPAGSGAVQAQATTSSTVGGNARGVNAVDWQTTRASASQVASGTGSFIGGGGNNTASGFNGTVAGGGANTASGTYTFIGSGYNNTASIWGAVSVNGYQNNASGYYSFIGSGQGNTGTSGSPLTSQSGTMNGTTAVTLSGSNANIKIGQVVTGTYMNGFPPTYVSAISGTSLTLSQNATGSGTATLNFYTPHGVVVGGGNNTATGSYSFIGGGGDAGTSGNRNVASGDGSVVVGGIKNQATGIGSFVGGGGWGLDSTTISGSIASGNSAAICGGFNNVNSGGYGFVGGGAFNTVNSNAATIAGGRFGTTRGIIANTVFPACYSPITGVAGVSQGALLVLAKQTTDATASVLTSDGAVTSAVNQVILPNNSAYYFFGTIVAGVTGGGDSKGWRVEGLIKRGASAAATTLVGSTVTSSYADAGASTWTIALTADTTNGGLAVTFTGQLATTIRCVAKIETTEMTF